MKINLFTNTRTSLYIGDYFKDYTIVYDAFEDYLTNFCTKMDLIQTISEANNAYTWSVQRDTVGFIRVKGEYKFHKEIIYIEATM